MSTILYDSKSELYFKNNLERGWILDQKNIFETLKYNDDQKDILRWKNDFYSYLNNSMFTSHYTQLIDSHYHHGNQSQKLNINSFLNHDWKGIEIWKTKILYEIDWYLKNNSLIQSKQISVQFIGSIGSKNPIPFSDFDCLIILPTSIMYDNKKIKLFKRLYNKLNYFAYLYDPFQHHNVFTITEIELANGLPIFYPLRLLENKWGYGRNHFYYKDCNDNNCKMDFINNNQYLRKLDHGQCLPNTAYHLKYILSVIYIMPVYFFNAKNKYYSKRESIEKIKRISPMIKDYFNWISKFRDFWPMSKFPIVKQKIFYGGINIFPARSMDFFNRRIDFHLRYDYQIKPLLKHSNTIINRGRKISDYLLDILHM